MSKFQTKSTVSKFGDRKCQISSLAMGDFIVVVLGFIIFHHQNAPKCRQRVLFIFGLKNC